MSELEGKKFGELKQLKEITDNTQFIFSKTLEDGTLSSFKVNYSNIRDYILEKYRLHCGFGSMAYENKYDYSKIDHKHPYTSVDFVSVQNDYEVQLGEMNIIKEQDISSYTISRPKIIQPVYPEPKNGEMRFVYGNDHLNETLEDINSDDFDGWILANGLKVRWSDVKNPWVLATKDKNMFSSEDKEYLCIPAISNFIRLVNDVYDDALSVVPQYYQAPSHKHKIIDIGVRMNVSQCGNTGIRGNTGSFSAKGDKIIGGDQKSGSEISTTYGLVTIQDEMSIKNLSVESTTDQEIYPTHDVIPVMVYIGPGSLKDVLSVTFCDYDGRILKQLSAVNFGDDAEPPQNPTRTGCIFKGWNPSYKNIRRDLTCYAQYIGIQYKITFEKNGGEGGTDNISVAYLDQLPVIEVPEKPGNVFRGYYGNEELTGNRWYNEQGYPLSIMSIPNNTTLYARWIVDDAIDNFNSYDYFDNHYGTTKLKFFPGIYDFVVIGAGGARRPGDHIFHHAGGGSGAAISGSIFLDDYTHLSIHTGFRGGYYTTVINKKQVVIYGTSYIKDESGNIVLTADYGGNGYYNGILDWNGGSGGSIDIKKQKGYYGKVDVYQGKKGEASTYGVASGANYPILIKSTDKKTLLYPYGGGQGDGGTSYQTLGFVFIGNCRRFYTLKYNSDNIDNGKVSGTEAGLYQSGTKITIVASPQRGCEFLGWYDEDVKVSDNQSYEFEINSDVTLTAKFHRSEKVGGYWKFSYLGEQRNVEYSTSDDRWYVKQIGYEVRISKNQENKQYDAIATIVVNVDGDVVQFRGSSDNFNSNTITTYCSPLEPLIFEYVEQQSS